MMNWERSGQGFTLIEVLIVITILAILTAITTTAVIAFVGTGDNETQGAEHRAVYEALTAAMVEGDGVYPASVVVSPGSTGWTRDMTTDLGPQCHTNMATYMDRDISRHWYTWTVNGRLVQCSANSPSDCGNAW